MAKKQPKPDRDDEDPDAGADEEATIAQGPTPWNIEIEFVDNTKKSEMRAVRSLVFDEEHLQIQTEDGKFIGFPFDMIQKVLVMHSTRYDAYVENRKAGRGGEQSE